MDYDVNQIIKDIRSITRALSLTRILKVCFLMFLSLIIVIVFERRSEILSKLLEPIIVENTQPIPTSLMLTNFHINSLEKILQSFPGVNGVAVVSVNLRENTKNIIFQVERAHQSIQQSLLSLGNVRFENQFVQVIS